MSQKRFSFVRFFYCAINGLKFIKLCTNLVVGHLFSTSEIQHMPLQAMTFWYAQKLACCSRDLSTVKESFYEDHFRSQKLICRCLSAGIIIFVSWYKNLITLIMGSVKLIFTIVYHNLNQWYSTFYILNISMCL